MRVSLHRLLLVTVLGLLGMLAGYLWNAPVGPTAAGADSDARAPAKSQLERGLSVTRTAKVPGGDDAVDANFVQWMRRASEEDMRAMGLTQFDRKFAVGNFRAEVLLRELLRRDPNGTYEFFRARTAGRVNLMPRVRLVWASVSPLEAAKAELLEADSSSQRFPGLCFRILAQHDFEAAIALALPKPGQEGPLNWSAIVGALYGYATTAPMDMPRWLGKARELGIDPSAAVEAWAASDPEAAIAWVRQEGNTAAAASLALGLSDEDPMRALRLYQDLADFGDPPDTGGIAKHILFKWMSNDFQTAANWIQDNLSEDNQAVYLRDAMRSLMHNAPQVLAEALQSGEGLATRFVSWSEVIPRLSAHYSPDQMLRLLDDAPQEHRTEIRNALIDAGL